MTGDFGRPTRPPTALTQEGVAEGLPFVAYQLNEPKSRREGEFGDTVCIPNDREDN